jgi:carbon storage regulator
MLYLTRRIHESIQISDEITVTVVRINSRQTCLGIEAPKHMTVLRTELLERSAEAKNHLHEMASANDEGAMAIDDVTSPQKSKPKITYKRRKTGQTEA